MAVNFQEFLKNNGINDFESRVDREMTRIEPKNWISIPFLWIDQPEGWDFWSIIDMEWEEICKKEEVYYGKEFPTISN
jgi:hypothetical protein